MLRVAFTPFVDPAWTGGIHYMRNLFTALADLPDRPVEPVLFRPPDAPAQTWQHLLPFLTTAPVVIPAWAGSRGRRLARVAVQGRDPDAEVAFKAAGVDLVFVNDTWYGHRCALPTLAWIADFQHCHLPGMFTRRQRWMRSAKFAAYCRFASRVMVSSLDGQRDCETCFPASQGRVDAVPFAVEVAASSLKVDTAHVVARHNLPDKFFFFPAQMWRHKNHLAFIDALARLKATGVPFFVAASGHAADVFRPDYPGQVMRHIAQAGLEQQIRFLGHLPYADLLALMRCAAAVVNPSLFEGWSTTVEEAKSLGVPLVLSNLRVHREQAPAGTHFFDPTSVDDMARVLASAWADSVPGPRPSIEASAWQGYQQNRVVFARGFAAVAQKAQAGGLAEK